MRQPSANFSACPSRTVKRVGGRIDRLSDDPRPPGCVKLSGTKSLWRIRVGTYRVIYSIEDVARIVAITKVAHRRDAYRGS